MNKIFPILAVVVLCVVVAAIYARPKDDTPVVTDNVPARPVENESMESDDVQGQLITIVGRVICLPHKDGGEMQTMECAYGIKETSTGKNYSLRFNDPMTNPDMEKDLTIEGTYYASTSPDSMYDTVGYINVSSSK